MTALPRRFAALPLALAGVFAAAARQAPSEGKSAPERNAAQIELLETRYRFEANGDSRKEVHTRVRINNEIGARQFARLNFDFNRSFQSVEIPEVRVRHASGGTVDVLPSAVTDAPNPAVAEAPAYQDVRVKSVRILGLSAGDLLEYRVVTTTSHHPLAPDFWVDHSFDRSGVVSEEEFLLDLPSRMGVEPRVNPETPGEAPVTAGEGNEARTVYRWKRRNAPAGSAEKAEPARPDVLLSTFKSWERLAAKLGAQLFRSEEERRSLPPGTGRGGPADGEIASVYEFVSQKIRTVDLPLGSTGYRTRQLAEILTSGYGSPEDKFALLAALEAPDTVAALVSSTAGPREDEPPSPASFDYLLAQVAEPAVRRWLDANLEVAPYGLVPARFRGQRALAISRSGTGRWLAVEPPARSDFSQHVKVSAAIGPEGALSAKVGYTLRGDNELLLRATFHRTPRDKWKEVAQLLALSDGFRGEVVDVSASDPYRTGEPFRIEYEISQPKFVDWTKPSVRVPAILPLPGLPEPPAPGSEKPIRLGTPLLVELEATVQIPGDRTARAPVGTSVTRDYAAFSSKYSVEGRFLRASRSLRFILPELPASRAGDFNAFLRAIQSDQSQLFSLERAAPTQTGAAAR